MGGGPHCRAKRDWSSRAVSGSCRAGSSASNSGEGDTERDSELWPFIARSADETQLGDELMSSMSLTPTNRGREGASVLHAYAVWRSSPHSSTWFSLHNTYYMYLSH